MPRPPRAWYLSLERIDPIVRADRAVIIRGGPPTHGEGGSPVTRRTETMADYERPRRLEQMLDRVAELRRYL